jgi:kynurenine 3-monooxygenase
MLAAHCILSRGDKFDVEIVESREDPRQTAAGPRSYSLGLNLRGQAAINHFDVVGKSPGLWGSLTPLGVESDSFFLHIGSKKFQLRKPSKNRTKSADEVPATLLIPRNKLCVGMLENLEKLYSDSGRLSITFNSRLLNVDLENKVAEFDEAREADSAVRVSKKYDLIIGADGVQSELRNAMQTEGERPTIGAGVDKVDESFRPFRCEEVVLPGQYKVMLQVMPPTLEADAVHAMEAGKKAGYGLFLIPSPGNNTCALLSWKGEVAPAILKEGADPEEVKASISANYPLFGTPTDEAIKQLSAQRPSAARTVRCNRYHRSSNGVSSALLMGDAAHSTGGTLGQGANSALMDVVALERCLEETNDDISAALPLFSKRQVIVLH